MAAATRAGRRRAESIMVDTCRIRRVDPDNPTTRDPDTLEEVPNYLPDPIYTGPCRVQRSGALSPRDQSPGGYEFGVDSILAQLPIATTGIKRGDVFEVTALGAVTDPALLGMTATVRADMTKTHATKRTLVCEGVSS